jgi:hypothetical protein
MQAVTELRVTWVALYQVRSAHPFALRPCSKVTDPHTMPYLTCSLTRIVYIFLFRPVIITR